MARIELDKSLGSIVAKTPSNRISKTVRFWVVGCSGIDHIMVGTDYPYDLGDWDAVKKVEQLDIPGSGQDADAGRQRQEASEN